MLRDCGTGVRKVLRDLATFGQECGVIPQHFSRFGPIYATEKGGFVAGSRNILSWVLGFDLTFCAC
jgi:hypothetical protein